MLLLITLYLSNVCTPLFQQFQLYKNLWPIYTFMFIYYLSPNLFIQYVFTEHLLCSSYYGGVPGVASGKEPACQCRRHETGSIPESGRSPGEVHGNLLQSCLENPMNRGAWWTTVHRVSQSWKQLKQIIQTLLGSRHWSVSWHMKQNCLS